MLITPLCCSSLFVLRLVFAWPQSTTWAGSNSTTANLPNGSSGTFCQATRRGSNDLFVDSSPAKSSQGLIYNNALPERSITREDVLPGPTSVRKPLLTNSSPYKMTWIHNSTIRNGLLSSIAPSQGVITTINDFLTVTRTATVPSDACCFVVQDTINVRYWAHYNSTTVFYNINATKLITSYTHYIDTIVTNTDVSKTALPTSSVFSFDLAIPLVPQYNDRPGPVATLVELNGTKTTTDRSTITSPAAFYEYSSVKIILVPAVTDQGGEPVCVTTSIYTLPCTGIVGDSPRFSGINAYAESYFGSSLYNSQLFNSTSMTSTKVSHFSPRSIAEIHFATPFVYLPLKGASESLGIMPDVVFRTFDGALAVYTQVNASNTISTSHSYNQDDSEPDYGYVPQALIDWMARDPDYVSRYPYIASCYPGGPSIKPDNIQVVNGQCEFFEVSPEAATAVPDLTISTHVTVSSAGCFHPGACPTPAPAAIPKGAAPAHTGLPVTSEETSLDSPAPEQSQNQQAAVTDSPTTAPGLGGIIASALGGNPFAPLPSAPSSNAPSDALSPYTPTPPSNTPAPKVPSLNTPEPAPNVPSSSLPTSSIPISNVPQQVLSATNLEGGQNSPSSYAISLALPPSVIVINGVTTSVPPAFTPPSSPPPSFTVGGQILTPNPTAFSVAGTTLSADGPDVTVSGTLVSLGTAGTLVIGTSTTVLANGASSSVFTVGDQTFTANPTAFAIAGTTISAGGPGVTIAGTRVSLGPSGTLIVGTSTTSLSPTAVTVGNQIFTPNPTAFAFANTSLLPGGPGVTIAGTPVSLAPAGNLIVGNRTTALTQASSTVLGFTGQAGRKEAGVVGLVGACAVMLALWI